MEKQPMAKKKAEMKVYKEQLLLLRARLRGDVNAMAKAALTRSTSDVGGRDSVDVGDNFDQEFNLSLVENEGNRLELIEDALVRIEKGVYGQCESCSGRIPKTRLNVIPYTPYCVKCADQSNRS